MNAYQLADELKACIDDGSTDLVCVCGAVNMLRQLADELKACKIHDRRGWEYAEELEQERRKQADRIAELEKQIKPLSGVEIIGMSGQFDFNYDVGIIDFARAIEAKVRGEK